MNKNLTIVFVRNPELGKVKTRLAKTIGDEDALKIYTILLQHTESVLHKVSSDKVVYYSEEIQHNDLWEDARYQKKLQKGVDLGARMPSAFETAFKDSYEKVVIVGSDLFDLKHTHIKQITFSCWIFIKHHQQSLTIKTQIIVGPKWLFLKQDLKQTHIKQVTFLFWKRITK